jgi:hypothetical protein
MGYAHYDPRRSRLRMLLIGVICGAALVGLAWRLEGDSGSEEGDKGGTLSSSVQRQQPPAASPGAGAVTPIDDRVSRCGEVYRAQTQPLSAAARSMSQWQVHIGAMNKLVVGAITLPQATAFWNQTRVGAAQRIAAFRKTTRAMHEEGIDCPAPGLLSRTASPALRTCARQVDAQLGTVRVARTAIRTWDMHVQDMERLRTGKLSPARATAMWLSMWRIGQHELDVYRAANQTVRTLGDCRTPAGAHTAPSTVPSVVPSSVPSMSGMH